MARVGINPARGKDSAYQPARVSAAVLTYIPHQAGYFKHRLQVLQLTLNSLRANAQLPCDLLVFDNGSCAPVVEYLTGMREAGQIDYLILSKENVGKIGALKILFQAAPGEVIAYSDDDILFYPGWLEPQLALLDGIPNAGMVSGVPVRFAGTYAVSSVERLLENGPAGLEVTRERFIPDGWEIDWAQSTGREPAEHLQAMKNWSEFVLRCGDLTAIGSANHFQFVARKEVILKALPEVWTGAADGRDGRDGRSYRWARLFEVVHIAALHAPPGQRAQPRRDRGGGSAGHSGGREWGDAAAASALADAPPRQPARPAGALRPLVPGAALTPRNRETR